MKDQKGYHKLLVWKRLSEFLVLTYELINTLPSSEEYGLKSQMKRAIVSVLSNFVEGYLKRSKKDKIHFLEIAETSLMELEAQAEMCLILQFWKEEDWDKFEEKRRECGFLLYKYRSSIY